MKFLKIFEEYKKSFREVDLAKIWNCCINDINFMRIYYDEFEDDWQPPKRFFQQMLKNMLLDKEIEFRRVIHPIDDEISFTFCGRVKEVFVTDQIVVNLYEYKDSYVLANFYAGKMSGEEIIKIYNSEITETEQKIEEIEMRLDAKKYNL